MPRISVAVIAFLCLAPAAIAGAQGLGCTSLDAVLDAVAQPQGPKPLDGRQTGIIVGLATAAFPGIGYSGPVFYTDNPTALRLELSLTAGVNACLFAFTGAERLSLKAKLFGREL